MLFRSRCQEIVRQLRSKANALKCRLEVEPAHLTDGAPEAALLENPLVQEVTALVEWPNVLPGQFEETFLEVPQECLILTMKANTNWSPSCSARVSAVARTRARAPEIVGWVTELPVLDGCLEMSP